MMTESVLVEVPHRVRGASRSRDSGEVVITDLNNVAMPLVRYRLEDHAVKVNAVERSPSGELRVVRNDWLAEADR